MKFKGDTSEASEDIARKLGQGAQFYRQTFVLLGAPPCPHNLPNHATFEQTSVYLFSQH